MGDDLNKTLDGILASLRADLTEAERAEADKLVRKVDAGRADRMARVARAKLKRAIVGPNIENAREALADANPDALWPDGFDAAFLGPALRCGQPTLAAFSMKKAIQVLMDRDGMEFEEAAEFFDFNVVGAWMGPGTPIWIDDTEDED